MEESNICRTQSLCRKRRFPVSFLVQLPKLSHKQIQKISGEIMKVMKWIGIVLVGIFIIIQVIRPERTNPPVDESRTIASHVQVPPAVAAILDRSCNDCHS